MQGKVIHFSLIGINPSWSGGQAVILAISQRNLLDHNGKQLRTLPTYKLNVMVTLLFTLYGSLET